MNTLDQNIFDSITVTNHPSESEAAQQLSSLAASGSSNTRLFRGQVHRQPSRRWPPVDEPQVQKHALEMENLVPSDYRLMEARLEKGESKAGLEPIYGDRIAGVRSALTEYLAQCHPGWGDHTVQAWINTMQGVPHTDALLSIGQHYGLRTHLMDWSFDWQVAFWFATHEWSSGGYVQGGDAVVYWIDSVALEQAEQEANQKLGLSDPNRMFRHIDISGTPAILAPRAFAQKGFSVYGLESPHLLQALISKNGISVHVFPRGTGPSVANTLTKALLVPPVDQMAVLFEECEQQGSLFQQAIGWINSQHAALAATSADGQHIF